MRLYDINLAMRMIAESTDEHGLLPPDVEAQFDALAMTQADKVDALVCLYHEAVKRQQMVKAEVDRLAQLAQVHANQADRYKKYLEQCLRVAGLERMDGLHGMVWLQNSPAKVNVACPIESLPSQFVRVSYDVDKTALAEWAADKKPLPEGVTITQGQHVRIK